MFKKLISTLLCLIFMLSCKFSSNNSSDNSNDNKTTIDASLEKIKLGEKISNPFSVNRLKEKGLKVSDSEANWLYFRVRVEENCGSALTWLSENFGNLEPVPLDRIIVKSGYYYDDPDIDEETECPWFYYCLPIKQYEQIQYSEHNFIIEILDRLYIEDGLLDCLEIEDTTEQYNKLSSLKSTKDLIKTERTKWLGIGGVHKAKPSGKVTYYDVLENKTKPLKNVKIEVRQALVNYRSTYTNSNGEYKINTTFSDLFLGDWVDFKIVFENEKCIFDGYGNVGQYIVSAYYGSSWLKIKELSNKSVDFSNNKRLNGFANLLNAVEDYHEFCAENNITAPGRLRIWINSNTKTNSGMTGLFRYTGVGAALGKGVRDLISLIPSALSKAIGWAVGAAVSDLVPDIVINIPFDKVEDYNISTLYHELGHASHFFSLYKSGWMDSTWLEEYVAMGWHWISCIFHGKNPTQNTYPNNSKLVDLIESMGLFCRELLFSLEI